MREEICKEYLETSDKLYIHEFDEVIENDRQTNSRIDGFNEVINKFVRNIILMCR